MAAIYQTAYPRIKEDISENELIEIYTPSRKELNFALKHCTKNTASHLGLLIQLKMLQRLGRFVKFLEIPKPIIIHIKQAIKSKTSSQQIKTYFSSGRKSQHVNLLRQYLRIKPYNYDTTSKCVKEWALEAAKTKEELPDIINVTIERLVKERYELPGFTVLNRISSNARSTINNTYYQQLCSFLDPDSKKLINKLLQSSTGEDDNFGWSTLKNEPKRPTPKNIRTFIAYLDWLKELQDVLPVNFGLPPVKHRQFINEAKALDYAELNKTKVNKRYAMVIVLIRHQYAKTLDNAADIFIKVINKIDNTAEKNLEQYLIDHQNRTENLIEILSDTVKAYIKDGPDTDLDKILGKDSKKILLMCEEYMAYAGNNYLPFMLPLYKNQRAVLFRTIDILSLESATNDKDLIKAFKFILKHKNRRVTTLNIQIDPNSDTSKNVINIRWIRDKWWKLVTGKSSKTAKITEVNRAYFELCVFVRIAEELQTGDLFIPYSEKFDDYREQMISWEEYKAQHSDYCDEVGLEKDENSFIEKLKSEMIKSCHSADEGFPENELLKIEDGKLILGKVKSEAPSTNVETLDKQLKERMEKISLLDVIIDVENWLTLSSRFGPLSGFESRIDDPIKRFILTLFCYGTNIGPTETVRSVNGFSRKQISWLNIKRVTEERLDKVIKIVVNAYKKYRLIDHWGTGNSVSADGKLWDLYEDNLLSEYHIRYGSYGGIAYYHISDTYIALFSRFIPCGVYEAIYILDGLLNEQSDFNPDTIHGDTQAQSTPVFGLAYLLGIKLMPRIRNIKDLIFYKPDRDIVLKHINSLFSDPIKWDLIKKHYADMMRIAMSVKAGKITASTILRRFGTKNRKNKLYFAFRELGRVVRTIFLLEYISDIDLRKIIQAATCKSEEFNQFAQWLFFANGGKVGSNLKNEQSKIVKYNHLLANMVILYNVNAMTETFNQLKLEGFDISKDDVPGFSPYRTEHLGRLGSFDLDLSRKVKPMGFNLQV